MKLNQIICVIWPMIILPVWANSQEQLSAPLGRLKHKRQATSDEENLRLKKQPISEKPSVPDDDEDKKTLAQQVLDGKYGLIQKELFSEPVKRPGIISYEVNPEVPRDNINNLGGLKEDDIWLAENHLLVLKGGGFSDKEQNVNWPPIDNYIAPQRQVKIPPNPKVPPPFPIQLKEGGPVEVMKGKNSSKGFQPEEGGGFGGGFLFPIPQSPPKGDAKSQGNFTKGNGGLPFPFLPLGLGLYPPAIAFLPPPGNLTELDEDDPRIYYPPKYDFVYKKNYSSHVPPGPLVPGIILPPPPDFFAPLEESNKSSSAAKSSPKKNTKSRIIPNRQKPASINQYKTKSVQAYRHQKVISPIQPNINKNPESKRVPRPQNKSNDGWMPIPAPRPFYITDISKLKALTANKATEQPVRYSRPMNGWDYENSTSMEVGVMIQEEFSKMNDFKTQGRGSPKKENFKVKQYEDNNSRENSVPYTTEKNEHIPQYVSTDGYEETIKSTYPQSTLLPHDYATDKNRVSPKPNVIKYSGDKINTKLISLGFPQRDVSSVFEKPSTFTNYEGSFRLKNEPISLGKGLKYFGQDDVGKQFVYEDKFEVNTLAPQKNYEDVTVKPLSVNGKYIASTLKYNGNTLKPTNSPLYSEYYDQESKYQADDSGYSYNVPVNPYRIEPYFPTLNQQQALYPAPTTTTKKPPVYEYSYSAPGYGTVESPKVGNSIVTTPRPIIFETDFKPIKPTQFTYFEYQPSTKQTTRRPVYSTLQPPVTPTLRTASKPKQINPESYQTENPYPNYHTQEGLLDEITKKYFSLFGQRINPDSSKEVTSSIPPKAENYYYKDYDEERKEGKSKIRFPEVYRVQSDRPYYDDVDEVSQPTQGKYYGGYREEEVTTPGYRQSSPGKYGFSGYRAEQEVTTAGYRQPTQGKYGFSGYRGEQEVTTPGYRGSTPGKYGFSGYRAEQEVTTAGYRQPGQYAYNGYRVDQEVTTPGYRQPGKFYSDYREEEDVVRPGHPLHSDISVNYRPGPGTATEEDAELIGPGYLGPGLAPQLRQPGSYVSYRLPGNAGHFFFLTPQPLSPPSGYPLPHQDLPYQPPGRQTYIRRQK